MDTGWPSERRVVITAGLAFVNSATASLGSGGFDMGDTLRDRVAAFMQTIINMIVCTELFHVLSGFGFSIVRDAAPPRRARPEPAPRHLVTLFAQ
ncbi:hypothetical protein [Streptomyces sp. NPDC000880]